MPSFLRRTRALFKFAADLHQSSMEPPQSEALLTAIFAAMGEPPLRSPKTQGSLIVFGYLLFVVWTAREVATIASELSGNDELTIVICAFGWLALALALAAALHTCRTNPALRSRS